MSIITYKYYKRGKCQSCNDVLWTTDLESSVVCSCTEALITRYTIQNCSSITDEEHIAAIIIDFKLNNDDTLNIVEVI